MCNHTSPGPPHPASSPPRSSETIASYSAKSNETKDSTMTDPNTSSFFIDFGSLYEELNFTYNDSEFTLNPNTQPCNPFTIPDALTIAVSAFYILIFVLAIPGNLVVGLVISRSKQALPPSDLYLLHLAVADLLLAVTLPFWAISVTQGWVFGDAMCKIITIIQELSFYSSILFLTCISMDRYMVIVRAMEARRANRQLVSWGICASVWCVGALLSLPGLLNSAYTSQSSSHTVCAEKYDPKSADVWRLVTRILRHTLGFLIPLAIMLPCYGVTIKRLLHIRGGFQRQRAMRVIVFVVVAFLLCWTPYHVTVMVDTFFRSKIVQYKCQERIAVDQAMFATQSLGLLHSCINPVLYAFVGEKFRRRLQQFLKKMGVLERVSVSRSSKSSLSSEITSTFM
ncbi:C-X-C chemokine receptor type 2-like isoform X1 [Xyrichtys novacula]|uniref:C-X-C chemokine receptor type 2-like isoform X1 n=1 Tax=Xyrichtys novacula TaxID=13765 RepID=A0AAV1H3G9_XYRNO|nr:C-X-C chemokine receptor type 2-like isoform X1 [Xyrichtys novacula]